MTRSAIARAPQARMSTRNVPSAWAAVYVGCQCIGHIIGRGAYGLEAFDRDDKSIGMFGSQSEAADALGRLLLQEPAQ
jgi:hypothetical protein